MKFWQLVGYYMGVLALGFSILVAVAGTIAILLHGAGAGGG